MRFALMSAIFLIGTAGLMTNANAELDQWNSKTNATETLPPVKPFGPNDPDTTPPPTTTPTEPPTTTTPTTTTTTTEPTTTTTTEPTTTTTTTEPTTTTTTEPTTTTTTEPTTTTVAPTPKPRPPNPSSGYWSVVDEVTNKTCVIVKMAASFIVPYETLFDGMKNATVLLAANATSTGTCLTVDGENQSITLSWAATEEARANQLTLAFRKNESKAVDKVDAAAAGGKDQFVLSEINVMIFHDKINFPNASSEKRTSAKLANLDIHPTNMNHSYRCNAEEQLSLPISAGIVVESVVLTMNHVQFEAFCDKPSDIFSSAMDCSADGIMTSDIVPIAVGCALAALVVIVLIAYLIGRRRARQRGYQSV